MTAPSSFARKTAFGLLSILALLSAIATGSTQAAQVSGLGTITLCIKKSNPEQGRIRFVANKKKCKGSEKRVLVVTTQSEQGIKGIEENSSSAGPKGDPGPEGARGPQG